eukprot:c16264_g1_i1 orf=1124-1567(+)
MLLFSDTATATSQYLLLLWPKLHNIHAEDPSKSLESTAGLEVKRTSYSMEHANYISYPTAMNWLLKLKYIQLLLLKWLPIALHRLCHCLATGEPLKLYGKYTGAKTQGIYTPAAQVWAAGVYSGMAQVCWLRTKLSGQALGRPQPPV